MSTVTAEVSTDLFVEHAHAIGRERLAEARELEDGSLSWHPGYGVKFEAVPDSGMFNGRVGEAFFLAALHAATGDPEMREAALRVVGPLRARCAAPEGPAELLAEVGYGLTGVGSMVYALARMARYLDEPALLDGARSLAAVLTPAAIALDHKHEVFWGTAGAALGLLALAGEEREGGRWVAAAADCAEHLLARRMADPESGLRAWATSGPTPDAGFAHGSSGIAHALLEVHLRTGEERFRAAALETFAFERAIFREHLMDWPDNRKQPDERVMTSWCHGATGVGLSRLALVGSLRPEEEEDVVSDLFIAIKRTGQRLMQGTDNLCCGTFGRMDFLLEAGIRLGNPAPRRQAEQAARRRLHGGPGALRRVVYDTGEHMDTGLWQGISGAGYQLLRLAQPERFPSVLLLA